MYEVLLEVASLLSAMVVLWLLHKRTLILNGNITTLNQNMAAEGDLMRENMQHIASALVGVSELLEEAESVVDDVARIPSPGEMLFQMAQSFMMNKLAGQVPSISPVQPADLISTLIPVDEHAETQPSQTQDNQTP